MVKENTFDAIVVGAGIAGTGTAYHLARSGLKVALLDEYRPGFAASGRNPGFLWLQTKAAGASMQFSLACRRYAASLADDFPDFGFRASGGLFFFRDPAYEPVARALVADRIKAGLPVEYLDRQQIRDAIPQVGPEVTGGIWNPLDAHQDTRRLIVHLVNALSRLRASVRDNARVANILEHGGTCTGVRLADGSELSAPVVVVTGGPWSNALLSEYALDFPFEPVRFEAAETAPAPFRIGPVVAGQSLLRRFAPAGAASGDLPIDPVESLAPELGFTEQVASLPDGSIQFGCAFEMGTTHDHPTVAGQAMGMSLLARNFPALGSLPVTRSWGGIVAQTPDALPVIHFANAPQGLVTNSGHFFGNLAGVFSGRIVAARLTGEPLPFDPAPFSLDRFGKA